MTDGSPKSGLPVDLVGTLSDGCQPFFAFLALKKLDNHLGGHGLLRAVRCSYDASGGVGTDTVRDIDQDGAQ